MPFFLLSCSLFVLLRVLSFLLNLSSCIMFPFIHLFGGSAIFRFKKFKWTIQWHCRMNFTPYLTISFLSILSAQICINELNMTMYFFLVILFFSSSIYALELICLHIMCSLSAHLAVKSEGKNNNSQPHCKYTLNCATLKECVLNIFCSHDIYSVNFFFFLFSSPPPPLLRVSLAFTWVVEHEHNQNELKLTWGNRKEWQKKNTDRANLCMVA